MTDVRCLIGCVCVCVVYVSVSLVVCVFNKAYYLLIYLPSLSWLARRVYKMPDDFVDEDGSEIQHCKTASERI